MHPIFITIVRLLLGFISFAFPVQCAIAPNQGFIFPQVSNPSIPDVFNLTVHRNDSMIVEYTQFEYTTALDIAIYCYDSVQDAISNETHGAVDGAWDYLAGPYEDTGMVRWDFANGILNPNLTFCRFMLFNQSLDSCTWGPWNQVTQQSLGANSSTPFCYSPIFRVLANDTQEPTLWISEENGAASSNPPSMTATSTTQATCPPSGIPPLPIPTHWQLDTWPPLIENITFPV